MIEETRVQETNVSEPAAPAETGDSAKSALEADLVRFPLMRDAHAIYTAPAEGRYPMRAYLNFEFLRALAEKLGRQLGNDDLAKLFSEDGPPRRCGDARNGFGCGRLFQPVAVVALNSKALTDPAWRPDPERAAPASVFGAMAPFVATVKAEDGSAIPIEMGSGVPTPSRNEKHETEWIETCFCGGLWWWNERSGRVVRNRRGCLAEMREDMEAAGQGDRCYSIAAMKRVIESRIRRHQANVADGARRRAEEESRREARQNRVEKVFSLLGRRRSSETTQRLGSVQVGDRRFEDLANEERVEPEGGSSRSAKARFQGRKR